MSDERKAWLREQLDKFTECQLFSFGASKGFDIHSDVIDLLDEVAALKQQIELEAIVSGLVQDENAALKRELKVAQGIVLDYLQEGNPENQTEPFYSWGQRVDALLTAEKQDDD